MVIVIAIFVFVLSMLLSGCYFCCLIVLRSFFICLNDSQHKYHNHSFAHILFELILIIIPGGRRGGDGRALLRLLRPRLGYAPRRAAVRGCECVVFVVLFVVFVVLFMVVLLHCDMCCEFTSAFLNPTLTR